MSTTSLRARQQQQQQTDGSHASFEGETMKGSGLEGKGGSKLDWIKPRMKEAAFAACLEFVGTTMFLLLALGGIQSAAYSNKAALERLSLNDTSSINTVASIEQLLYIAASMGLSLLISVWLFYRVTGGLFNPNISLALMLVGAITPFRFVLYCVAQLLGAIVASALLKGLLPGDLVVDTAPGPGVSNAQAVFIEMFITSCLVLSVLMLAVEKHHVTPFAPIGIGLTLFAGHLWAVVYTGASMNTARSFGPAVVTEFNKTQWIYWVGPTLGSLLATAFYKCLKHVHYERLHPGQESHSDEDLPNASTTHPIAPSQTRDSVLPV